VHISRSVWPQNFPLKIFSTHKTFVATRLLTLEMRNIFAINVTNFWLTKRAYTPSAVIFDHILVTQPELDFGRVRGSLEPLHGNRQGDFFECPRSRGWVMLV
jgi:hypothetical protein